MGVYLSTIFGAWLAGRVLGAEKTLFLSGIVVMLGHIALSLIPGITGLLIGLPLIALGGGGVKPSANTLVGSLYESEEKRPLRDAGFSIFYISINIGSFFGPLITGLLQDRAGFHYGFGAAAVGLMIYSQTRRALPLTPPPNPLPAAHSASRWADCCLKITMTRNTPPISINCCFILARLRAA